MGEKRAIDEVYDATLERKVREDEDLGEIMYLCWLIDSSWPGNRLHSEPSADVRNGSASLAMQVGYEGMATEVLEAARADLTGRYEMEHGSHDLWAHISLETLIREDLEQYDDARADEMRQIKAEWLDALERLSDLVRGYSTAAEVLNG